MYEKILCIFTALLMTTSALSILPASAAETDCNVTVHSSNGLFDDIVVKAKAGDTLNLNLNLQSSYKIVNNQCGINYDSSSLKLEVKQDEFGEADVSSLYDFTQAKTYFTAKFDVINATSSTIDVNIENLTGSSQQRYRP